MASGMKAEVLRKAFHLLSLIYLAAYHLLGRPMTLALLAAWIALEGALEFVRLRNPSFNALLIGLFQGVHRPAEEGKVSGIFWTSAGAWLTIALLGSKPQAVDAALLFLAFGDGMAALAGKAFGKTPIPFLARRKTLEGTLACFAVCAGAGFAVGLPAPALWVGALVAAVVEFLPVPIDDNLWLPVLSGLAVFLLV